MVMKVTVADKHLPDMSKVLEKKCSNCLSALVCMPFRNSLKTFAQEWDENNSPIDPLDLAKICKAYIHNSVKLMEEDTED